MTILISIVFGLLLGSLATLATVWHFTLHRTFKVHVPNDHRLLVYDKNDSFTGTILYPGEHRVSKKNKFVYVLYDQKDGSYLIEHSFSIPIVTKDNRTVPLNVTIVGRTDNLLKTAHTSFGQLLPNMRMEYDTRKSFALAGREFNAKEIINNRGVFLLRVANIHLERVADPYEIYSTYEVATILLAENAESLRVVANNEIVDFSMLRADSASTAENIASSQ